VSGLEDALRAAGELSPEELRALARWIEQRLVEGGAAGAPAPEEGAPRAGTPGTVVEERVVGHKTYRLQYVRCGKAGCLCTKEQGHGPYWYAFWREGGRVRSQYIGKELGAGS
jgi:hypothetical protein